MAYVPALCRTLDAEFRIVAGRRYVPTCDLRLFCPEVSDELK